MLKRSGNVEFSFSVSRQRVEYKICIYFDERERRREKTGKKKRRVLMEKVCEDGGQKLGV